eukprot:CAMPEP_0114246490 /NCGR_PEP_ID=MMETSP0058-20121206/12494_1 /TAXON_ID=36894 /ORGANISM="Pyramimonas parkeae, CCMP726" /LENGTH=299 /DNA_ID=CAMNT_0001359687 /DNA_START=239 /DNA_END=1138 /DNA_ORIENTATION=-
MSRPASKTEIAKEALNLDQAHVIGNVLLGENHDRSYDDIECTLNLEGAGSAITSLASANRARSGRAAHNTSYQIDQKFSGTSRGLLQINPQQSSSASLGYLRRLHASMVNFIAQCSNRHGPVSPGGAAYKLARKTRDLGFPMQQNSRRLTNRKWGQVLSTVVWLLGCVFALHFLTDHPELFVMVSSKGGPMGGVGVFPGLYQDNSVLALLAGVGQPHLGNRTVEEMSKHATARHNFYRPQGEDYSSEDAPIIDGIEDNIGVKGKTNKGQIAQASDLQFANQRLNRKRRAGSADVGASAI